jgi:hypothetical protein
LTVTVAKEVRKELLMKMAKVKVEEREEIL